MRIHTYLSSQLRLVSFRLWLLLVVIAAVVVSCKPSAPSDVIQPGEMEDLLYDYHLADAMARQASGNYEENILSYHTAVLNKYGVTTAQFDSSMVYYMRHATQLHDMYENIAERMGKDAQAMGSSVSINGGNEDYNTLSGDTIDLWKGPQSMVLIPNEPYNLYSFHLKPDAKAQKGDDYVLTLHSNFIFQDGMRDGIVALALVFKNDSVASRVLHVSSSYDQQVALTDADSLGVKEIRGYFMLNKNNQMNRSTTTLQLVSFDKIHLLRCHRKAEKQPNQPEGNNSVDAERPKATPSPDNTPHASVSEEVPANSPGSPQVIGPVNNGARPLRKFAPNANMRLVKDDKVKQIKQIKSK